MDKHLKIKAYRITDPVYLNVLHQKDDRVMLKSHRPYIPIFMDKHIYWCAPLTSCKPKHLTMKNNSDLYIKINKGKNGLLEINSMIPVPCEMLTDYDMENNEPLQRTISYLRKMQKVIAYKSMNLYHKVKDIHANKYNAHDKEFIKRNCVNFDILENTLKEYTKTILWFNKKTMRSGYFVGKDNFVYSVRNIQTEKDKAYLLFQRGANNKDYYLKVTNVKAKKFKEDNLIKLDESLLEGDHNRILSRAIGEYKLHIKNKGREKLENQENKNIIENNINQTKVQPVEANEQSVIQNNDVLD